MRAIVFAVFCATLGWSAAAAQTPGPGGDEVWDLSASETPRHWFTGLTCWERAGDAVFEGRFAFMPSGADVACVYEGRDLSVTIYATRRPNDEPVATSITQTRQQIASRYRGATIGFDTQRALVTSAGLLQVDEFVLAIDGQDLQQNQRMRGATGAWQADIAGWTLKVRISDYDGAEPAELRLLADALLVRASNDMVTARECEGAGRGAAPNLNLSQEESTQVQVFVGMLGIQMAQAIPANPAAARAAGYVCLGETLNSRTGHQTVAVMMRPSAQQATPTDPMGLVILAIGEIRGSETMTAVVDSSMNPFGVEGHRADRGHFAFSRMGEDAGFYGAFDRGEPRLTAAQIAAIVADGRTPMISIGARPSE